MRHFKSMFLHRPTLSERHIYADKKRVFRFVTDISIGRFGKTDREREWCANEYQSLHI